VQKVHLNVLYVNLVDTLQLIIVFVYHVKKENLVFQDLLLAKAAQRGNLVMGLREFVYFVIMDSILMLVKAFAFHALVEDLVLKAYPVIYALEVDSIQITDLQFVEIVHRADFQIKAPCLAAIVLQVLKALNIKLDVKLALLDFIPMFLVQQIAPLVPLACSPLKTLHRAKLALEDSLVHRLVHFANLAELDLIAEMKLQPADYAIKENTLWKKAQLVRFVQRENLAMRTHPHVEIVKQEDFLSQKLRHFARYVSQVFIR
jgi:hypothetical protein